MPTSPISWEFPLQEHVGAFPAYLFDAPARPSREDMDWSAETFLDAYRKARLGRQQGESPGLAQTVPPSSHAPARRTAPQSSSE